MMQRLEFISTLSLFQGLRYEELEALAQSAREETYQPGQFLVKDEDEAGYLFLIREGRVKLTKTSTGGKEQTIYFYNPGDLLGLFTLFTGTAFPADAVALEKTQTLVFNKKNLEKAALQAPSLLSNLFFALAMRMNECLRTVESLSLKELPQRLAAFLTLMSAEGGTAPRIELPYSHRELAKVLGTSPESLSRAISRMSRAGVLRVDGRTIEILKPEVLGELADGC